MRSRKLLKRVRNRSPLCICNAAKYGSVNHFDYCRKWRELLVKIDEKLE